MENRASLHGLYAITPEQPDTGKLLGLVEAVLAGGARLLQYRSKSTRPAERLAQGATLLQACRRHGALLIVNDDPRLALAIEADGVHLGAGDGQIAAARELLGADKLIGASCYNSIELACVAARAGADYVAFGSMYASTSKPLAPLAELTTITQARCLGVPICAIGGITLQRAPAVLEAGASMLAVIGDLFDAGDPTAISAAYRQMFNARTASPGGPHPPHGIAASR